MFMVIWLRRKMVPTLSAPRNRANHSTSTTCGQQWLRPSKWDDPAASLSHDMILGHFQSKFREETGAAESGKKRQKQHKRRTSTVFLAAEWTKEEEAALQDLGGGETAGNSNMQRAATEATEATTAGISCSTAYFPSWLPRFEEGGTT